MATFYQIDLDDIRDVPKSELESAKLHALDNSSDSFEYQVNECSDANAVCLSGSKPYDIVNGRHRVFAARQKGWRKIRARFG